MSGLGSKRLVLPGDRLCVVEEFLPKKGAGVLRDGTVVATVAGYPEFRLDTHEVTVNPVREVDRLIPGDLVLCEVREVQERIVGCDVLARLGKLLRHRWSGAIVNQDSRPDLSIGDLVVAKVAAEVAGTYNLAINERGLGCVVAFCDLCGTVLKLRSKGLFCPRCGITSRKKIVSYYGNVNKVVEMFGFVIDLRN